MCVIFVFICRISVTRFEAIFYDRKAAATKLKPKPEARPAAGKEQATTQLQNHHITTISSQPPTTIVPSMLY